MSLKHGIYTSGRGNLAARFYFVLLFSATSFWACLMGFFNYDWTYTSIAIQRYISVK